MAAGFGVLLEFAAHRINQLGGIDGLEAVLRRARFHAAEVQQTLHKTPQPLAFARQAGEGHAVVVADDGAGVGDGVSERRSEFVRDGRNEIRLQPA